MLCIVTFPTSKLTPYEIKIGWYLCTDPKCKPTLGGRRIIGSHAHRKDDPKKKKTVRVCIPANPCRDCGGSGQRKDWNVPIKVDGAPARASLPCPTCKGNGDDPGSKDVWLDVEPPERR